jgi:hypothetical protein
MKEYTQFLITGTTKNPDKDYAFSINKDKFKKEIVEALLLSDANPDDVYKIFGISEVSLESFRGVFFDTTKFKTYLDKLSYIETSRSSFGKELKTRALSLGPEFIYFTYGKVIPTDEEQKALLKKLFLTSAYKAMELNFNSVSSQASKSAVELGKLMIKVYDSMQKNGEDDSVNETFYKVITKKNVDSPTTFIDSLSKDELI